MKNPLLFPLLSAVAFAAQSSASLKDVSPSIETESNQSEGACEVVAKPLTPHPGELRIKVLGTQCAHQIASVALRLQLDEFGEFKFLKKGAVVPDVQLSANQTEPAQWWEWRNLAHDYQLHDDAERSRLMDHRGGGAARPTVTQFTVAVPAVNYPPANVWFRNLNPPVLQSAFSHLAYRYIAIVTFTDGRVMDVSAGHTTFIPTVHASATKMPFTWNTTFEEISPHACEDKSTDGKKRAEAREKCLPVAQRSTFVAEISLEEGNAVRKGRPIKGRVTVHGTSGSTTMDSIYVRQIPLRRDHWALARAAAGGNDNFVSALCHSGGQIALDTESDFGAEIFDDEENDDAKRRNPRIYREVSSPGGSLTPAHPYFDFELNIEQLTPMDFESYYSSGENLLEFGLGVQHSQDVENCLYPNRIPNEDTEAKTTEESLWDSFTPVGKAAKTYRPTMATLFAVLPITVIGSPVPATGQPIPHYLTPGLPVPVLRRGVQTEAPEFPVAEPVFSVESLLDTSARLMQSGSSDPNLRYTNGHRSYPDPTKAYLEGEFAGLLWKKKVVAEARGIWPLSGVVEEGNDQERFAT
ncbi:hypothetical protein DFH09DRAFT_1110611 [Mycena vulgaris]|nr:hypothetical protein DFH09DRAFT_1110611 [Mycena vulgaris]